jgi:hypothetical protein
MDAPALPISAGAAPPATRPLAAPWPLRWSPVVALITATLWLGGNVLLVVMVTLLFSQAPPHGTEFTSHDAAGAVFGLVLARWYLLSGIGLLVPLLLATVLPVAWRQRRALELSSLALVVFACACHLAGARLLAVLNAMLVELRAHGAGGSGPSWNEFNRLHTESFYFMMAETVILLALVVLLATRLARR